MSEICNKCGLPQEVCVCEDIAKEAQGKINIGMDKRRYGKMVTILTNIDPAAVGGDLQAFAKKLKTHCACGGTSKDGQIVLQGDHQKKVTEKLRSMGFSIGN
jgi:translation initiation factor 1